MAHTFEELFSQKLLEWHMKSARDLPWRGETDPYRIWLSEIMLQQTRTETVKGYYHRFLEAFPDVYSLANAEQASVLKLWEGLGYYSRARNLHAAAKKVAYERNGCFPCEAKDLKSLPGIGEYAAGAIASIAFGKREPALDGNQARVLARVLNIKETIKTPAQLYDRALPLVPEKDPGEYNQALMGLGALLCTPKNPKCDRCPVKDMCLANAEGCQEELPVKPEKSTRKIEKRAVCIVLDDSGRVWVRKRGRGLLEGLWEFPGYLGARSVKDVLACLEEDGITAVYKTKLCEAKHIFTHLEWHMRGYVFRAKKVQEDMYFAAADEIDALAMPTALRVYREAYLKGEV